MPETPRYRFYEDLAVWWPLISPPEDYEEEASFIGSLFDTAAIPVRDVLELGSGGGHNAVHLKKRFDMTLVDLSTTMLEVSQALNPDCEHVRGDMTHLRLGQEFDAVFIHDAIDYMATEHQLREAIETAFTHCRPGGIVVLAPDHTSETFEVASQQGGTDAPDGRGVRYLEWSWDPDPDDEWTLTEYAFLLRDSSGEVEVVHETHRVGLFSRDVWIRLLVESGFDAEPVTEMTGDARTPREIFVGHRPRP